LYPVKSTRFWFASLMVNSKYTCSPSFKITSELDISAHLVIWLLKSVTGTLTTMILLGSGCGGSGAVS